MELSYHLGIVLAVLVGGTVFIFLPLPKSLLKLLLAFSGSFLLTVTVLHVLPEVFSEPEMSSSVGIAVLAGFFLQITLDFFSKGIEHGHMHVHHVSNKWLYLFPVASSLFLHSFIEGIPLQQENDAFSSLFWGIFFHNLPITLAFSALLREVKLSRPASLLLVLLFSAMTPLGSLVGGSGLLAEFDPSLFMGLAAGIFLHISTTILFETEENHTFHFRKFLAILLGLCIALLPSFLGVGE